MQFTSPVLIPAPPTSRRWLTVLIAATALGGPATVALAQSGGGTRTVALSESQVKRQNLARMLRPIDIDFDAEPMSNVMTFLEEYTGADLDPLWITDRQAVGLDPDAEITLGVKGITSLRLLELVLDQADADLLYSGGSTWQMSEWGSIQIGPKERLSRKRRLKIYDINDILFEIPNYPDVPTIDLQQALRSNEGGGQSPFQNIQTNIERVPKEERGEALIDLITAVVEPETWDVGADIRYYQGSLIVSAPDFVHRALDGYPWWPATATAAGSVNGKRYVSFNLETGISEIVDIAKDEIIAVVPGSGGGGGGGGPGGGGG